MPGVQVSPEWHETYYSIKCGKTMIQRPSTTDFPWFCREHQEEVQNQIVIKQWASWSEPHQQLYLRLQQMTTCDLRSFRDRVRKEKELADQLGVWSLLTSPCGMVGIPPQVYTVYLYWRANEALVKARLEAWFQQESTTIETVDYAFLLHELFNFTMVEWLGTNIFHWNMLYAKIVNALEALGSVGWLPPPAKDFNTMGMELMSSNPALNNDVFAGFCRVLQAIFEVLGKRAQNPDLEASSILLYRARTEPLETCEKLRDTNQP